MEWNFVSSFCACVMEENRYSYCTVSTDETTSKPNGSGSHHDHVLGNQECGLNKKNEQRVYQGCQSGADSAPEDQWGQFVFDSSDAGADCFSVLHDNNVSSISYLSYRHRDGATPRYHTDEKIFSVLIFQEDKK